MAPEYILNGIFSAKSDVFSYGVLLLEIVTGRRNTFINNSEAEGLLAFVISARSHLQITLHRLILLADVQVWRHWSRGDTAELLDCCTAAGHRQQEILRCVHVGLLCVQEDPQLRPGTAEVVAMLKSRSETLPQPSAPLVSAGREIGGNPAAAAAAAAAVDALLRSTDHAVPTAT
uniref:Protein kinase domain-containing protein n=1 Tax=Leersia perrieri TaxID=77586 RepID=A0A0D9WHX0_9ORYZ